MLTATDDENAGRWGFFVLPWLAIALVPLFLILSLGLAAFELYYQFATTSSRGRRFRRLLESLHIPSECRSPEDIRTIIKAISASEFLKAYPNSKLSRLCRTCELLEFIPQDAVFTEGEVGFHFFVLIQGTVDIYVSDKAPPHGLKCVNSFHDSGSFGELALIQVTLASAAAECRTCRFP